MLPSVISFSLTMRSAAMVVGAGVGEQITERVEVAPIHGVGEPGREVADVSIDREAFDGLLKLEFISLAFCVRCPGGWCE